MCYRKLSFSEIVNDKFDLDFDRYVIKNFKHCSRNL